MQPIARRSTIKNPSIILDLDGTLVDSALDIVVSVNHTLAALGLSKLPHDTIVGFVGHGIRDLITKCLGVGELYNLENAVEIFSMHYQSHITDHTLPYPGVRETLEILSGIGPLFVVSNKKESFSRMILDNLSLSRYFKDVIGGDTLPQKKPDPACVNYISSRHNIELENLVMVGDNHTDLETARRAGIPSIFCSFGYGTQKDNVPDAVANSFSELPELIASI